MEKNIVTIPSKITKGEELVIIPRSLYEEIKKQTGQKLKTKLFDKETEKKLRALGKKITKKEIEEAIRWARREISK